MCLTPDIVPVPAAGLKATPVSATSIRVAWQRVPDLGNPIDHYSVYFYDVKDLSASELEQTTTGNELTVVDLCKFCEYRFRVVAYNKNGPGISSDEISCRTHSDGSSRFQSFIFSKFSNNLPMLETGSSFSSF